jgi:superfamily II DNA or RNA helicase/HKD family nuclease
MNDQQFFTNYSDVRFLDKIKTELHVCKGFDFSVSFIKVAGLVLLFDDIENALKRGAHGRILTSTYQNFTDIGSLERFLSLQERYPNFECHLDFNSFDDNGFHTKGYLFNRGDYQEIVIGSSNITRFALLKNMEWDLAVSAGSSDPVFLQIRQEFDHLWEKTNPLTRDIIKKYTIHLEYAIESWDMDLVDPEDNRPIHPNYMQRAALKEIKRYRDMGQDKALVVAATGSGKTYLSAFDALNFGAKRLLYIVHRDTILREAMGTFMRVFGTSRTYGLYSGDVHDLEKDFIFASNQLLARHLELFDKNEFDYIIIDEVHHAAASTYREIMNHFTPQFMLGLTATPDRMDAQNVYELFHNNVPYDLRLREALENSLIVPFKYYGIHDNQISYEDVDNPEKMRQTILQIASSLHCDFIKEQIEKYRQKDKKLRCIGFCHSVEHARLMAEGMSQLGYECTYLSGSNDTGERIKAFQDLQDKDKPLEIIFTVDILNEGVDIPSINMVLFLRPTQSSTIFIQQLGRGLRHYEDKEYLTVLDFIANSYLRSVQIALALGSLSQSGTVDKRTIADHVRTDFSAIAIPGLEIHFDKDSEEEILRSIEHTNFNQINFLKADYQNFKEYLKLKPGEFPMHTDFLNAEVSADLLRYTRKYESYYDFLEKIGEPNVPFFNPNEVAVIRTLSFFLPLIRPYEYEIIQALLEGEKSEAELREICKTRDDFNDESFRHALRVLQNQVVFTHTGSFIALIKLEGGFYRLAFEVATATFGDWIKDLLRYGLERYQIEYSTKPGLLKLYAPYTGPKAFMALNNENMFYMSGVHYLNHGRDLCLFVNLNKDSQAEERLKYKDRFLSNKILQWESQTETTLTNVKGLRLMKQGTAHIFVRKVKKEDGIETPFVYLGEGSLTNPRVSDNPAKALLFDIVLKNEVPEGYKYDFGIEDVDEKKN